ncbi:MAG TPA: SIS domain-containing protein [Acidimicrobiales bacterium]|nr:SIS domain-containing protein [Acidimicrobiales bacterium]
MSAEPTGFLYPFIEADERDSSGLLADLAVSAVAKMQESRSLRAATLERCHDAIAQAGLAMAERFAAGGRLFAFGNGGSATDADGTVHLFRVPPSGRPLPAMSLVDDRAVLTALSNDVGFELVFSRQLIAHAHDGDIAVGFSTSGDSINMLNAFEEADRRGLLTVGLCGYEGAAMAVSDAVHHCLVVKSDSVHRIQEAQAAVMLAVWSSVQRCLAGGREPR